MEKEFRPSTFMVVPTMACNASCKYCFAQKHGERMQKPVIDSTIDFIDHIAPQNEKVKIIFHGGEPLLGGVEFYSYILPLLRERFGLRLQLSMQSNLWALNDELIELIRQYDIHVGTSLDGYREMCDSQRGMDYYARTTEGMRKLREAGVRVGTICTFGSPNVDKAAEVFERAGHNYSIHGAVKALNYPPGEMTLNVQQMKQVFLDSYRAYKSNPAHVRISTIDSMVKGCMREKGVICTFYSCLGKFAAIAPNGSIYTCNRFCGYPEFSLGNVLDNPDEKELIHSLAYKKLFDKQSHMQDACGGCPHFSYCNGGCLYSSFAGESPKDPYCEAYKAVFDEIQHDLALDMGSVLTASGASTPVLAMAGETEHPYDSEQHLTYIRDILHKTDLGKVGSRMLDFPENKLNQVFLNLTYRCPLNCRHCSAAADMTYNSDMPLNTAVAVVEDAIAARFRAISFTGGEPFVYSDFAKLLNELGKLNRKGTVFQLRTSLGFEIDETHLERAGAVFDRIIVSLDGDRESHDARRGEGRYDITVRNMKKLISYGYVDKIVICSVLTPEEKAGKEWKAVNALAKELGIGKVISRPLLPIGRNCDSGCTESFLPPDGKGLPLKLSCGLGRNIHIEPKGDAYPCYVCTGSENLLGNVLEESLSSILNSGKLYTYQNHTVDTNAKCRNCEVRYLCGGVCRAWLKSDTSLDSGDFDCTERVAYYRNMVKMLK